MHGLNSPFVSNSFYELLQSPSSELKVFALAGLLERNDPGALIQLATVNPSIEADPDYELVVITLRNSFRSADSTAVHSLGSTATAKWASIELKQAALRALSAIHSKDALPFLAQPLLGTDPDAQMSAVIGISSFANGCPPQTPENVSSMDYMQFRTPSPYRTQASIANFAFGPVERIRQAELVRFWTDWWMQNRMSLTSSN